MRFYENEAGVVTYRGVDSDNTAWFLKVSRQGADPPLATEAIRLRWAADHLPVPVVEGVGAAPGGGEWMLTRGLPGDDATRTPLRTDPEALTRVLARGLQRLHAVPRAACPFRFDLDDAMDCATQRVAKGLVLPSRHFQPEHAHLSAAKALALLRRTRPPSEDLVVCHGDYCLPNILVQDDRATGYVDLGDLAIADRWWDLATATWSVMWNLGPGLEALFLETYGAPPDPTRQAFFRLLRDVVS